MLSITKWEHYSEAKDAMLDVTDRQQAPWWTINSDDKRAARLNTISHLLSQIPYDSLDPDEVHFPERPAAAGTARPPIDEQRFVPDHAATL